MSEQPNIVVEVYKAILNNFKTEKTSTNTGKRTDDMLCKHLYLYGQPEIIL